MNTLAALKRTLIRCFKGIHWRLADHRILFLCWYGWVDVRLTDYLWKELGWRFASSEIIKDAVLTTGRNSSSQHQVFESLEDIRSATFDGFGLWEICKSSICDDALEAKIDVHRDRESIEKYFNEAVVLIRGFDRLFKELKPTTIVVEQGLQCDMRAAVEVARRQGIQTVAIENSFLKDYFFLDDVSGAITNRHTLARNSWDRIKARVLTSEQRHKTHEFLKDTSTTFAHPNPVAREKLLADLKVPADKKVALLIGQVATDAAIVMDSPIYEDQVDFMLDAVREMAAFKDTHHLVIRLHPKEATGNSHFGKLFENRTLQRLLELGVDRQSHVTIVHSDQANTYQIMECAEFGLTITSQAGLEMLARYKPLIVVGDAFYARKGFTLDVSHQCQLGSTLGCVVDSPRVNESQQEDIDNF
ncbi:MAG: hypothetical protein AAF483_05850, partial [Planctomycetota bacterium]